LTVTAASVERVEPDGARVRVHLSNGNGERSSLAGDLVINATGPHTRFSATRNPLLRNLLKRGLLQPDEMDMGVRVEADHTVIDGSGGRSPTLLGLGPLLRGTLWETIAVPELRGQALRVARTMLSADAAADAVAWDESRAADTIEYMI
jgi:uncharacterized NAD(P)/FAD-binding protein YdhS